jgi:hypothetical protein
VRDLNEQIGKQRVELAEFDAELSKGWRGEGGESLREATLRRQRDEEARDLRDLEAQRALAISATVSVVGVGVLFELVSAILKMLAWVGLAIRDSARNSFQLHRLAA